VRLAAGWYRGSPLHQSTDVADVLVEAIATRPAEKRVVRHLITGAKEILSLAALQHVGALDRRDTVSAGSAPALVRALAQTDKVLPPSAAHSIGAPPAAQLIAPGTAEDDVIPSVPVDQVSSGTAVDDVIAPAALDLVRSTESAYDVIAIRPLQWSVDPAGPHHGAVRDREKGR